MPIRQGGILASRASTWPRDHFCRSTMAPRASWPIAREGADALFVFPDPLTFGNRESIVGFANKNSIPAVFGAREFVEVGGLMSYGSDYPAMFRRAGNYVGRILNGASLPADLPVEQPTKFELIINLKTAKAFGF